MTAAPEGYPLAYMHSCGKPAFYLKAMPETMTPLRSDNVLGTDGKSPVAGSPIVCGHCGDAIPELLREDVKPA